jgi:hypothetical protein
MQPLADRELGLPPVAASIYHQLTASETVELTFATPPISEETRNAIAQAIGYVEGITETTEDTIRINLLSLSADSGAALAKILGEHVLSGKSLTFKS